MLLMKNYKKMDLNVKNKLFLILIVTLLIVGCDKKDETKFETKPLEVVDKTSYNNPLVCKKVTDATYNKITEYKVYDFDKDGKEVTGYYEIISYDYDENQSEENKSRYEKWYNCSNVSNTNLYKCDNTWVNDKRYKVTKTYNQGKISGLSGTSYEEMKDYVPNGFECE